MKQNKAKKLMDDHEWAKAIPVLLADIYEQPSDPWSHMFLGSCYYELRDYTKAIKWFKHSEMLLPENPTPIGLHGDALFAQGKIIEAGELYMKAFNLDKSNELAEKNLRRWLEIVKTENNKGRSESSA